MIFSEPKQRGRENASHRFECAMRMRRKLNAYGIARPYFAGGEHDCHHACSANQLAVLVAAQHGGLEPGLKPIDLHARIAQPGHLDHRGIAQMQFRAGWQRQEIEPAGGDVLAHVAGCYGKARRIQFFMQLTRHQVYLTQVGLRRIMRHSRPMFDGFSQVGIAFDAQSREKPYVELIPLAEGMGRAAADRNNQCRHRE